MTASLKYCVFLMLFFLTSFSSGWALDTDPTSLKIEDFTPSKKTKLETNGQEDSQDTPRFEAEAPPCLEPKTPLKKSISALTNYEDDDVSEATPVPSPEKNPPANKHYFSLTLDKEGTHDDSRSHIEELALYKHSFQQWHKDSIVKLKKYTGAVRKCLAANTGPSHANLLKYRVDLFVNESAPVEIYNSDDIWLSGWPTKRNAEKLKEIDVEDLKLKEELRNVKFKFISSMIKNFDKLLCEDQSKAMINKISPGYCLTDDKPSFLVQERLEYQKENLERARKEYSHFTKSYLHTEQGLMLFLGSDEFKQIFRKKLNDVTPYEGNSQLVLLVNFASSRSVCMNCADRLFRESEWGEGFLKSLEGEIKQKVLSFNLKIYFIASCYEPHTDRLKEKGGEKLRKYYQHKTKKNDHNKFGFEEKSGEINFSKYLLQRTPFDLGLPLIGQIKLSQ